MDLERPYWNMEIEPKFNTPEMRQIQNDQLIGHLGVLHCERPSDHPAPVVPDDDSLLAAEVLDHRFDVADKLWHRVVFDALRLVTFVVTTQIDRNDLKVLRECWYLFAPGVPEIGEPVQHHQ